MRRLGLVMVIAALAATVPAVAQETAVTPDEAAALGRQAYLYGFPLTEFARTRETFTSVPCPDRRGNAPVNAFSHVGALADPSARTVVAPNVDTLYSLAQLDLGRGPVVLSHPDLGRRYFVFELMDPYTNVVGYIGSRATGSKAGRFAITWSGHPGTHPKGTRTVTVPFRRLWVVGRTLTRGGADLERARRIQRHYRLTPPGGPRHFAKSCKPGAATEAPTLTGLDFVRALDVALTDNPPPAQDAPTLDALARVGIGPGRDVDAAGLSPEALTALGDAVTATANALPGAAQARVLAGADATNGWAIPPANIGDYGTDYVTRAGVAVLGFGANTPDEAVYPTAYKDDRGETLDGHRDYRVTFARGQLPPNRAFWSLTMYDANGFLVANPARRYAVGSSHPGLVRRKDGSVVVVVSHRKPKATGVTWLPAPRAPFRLNLRIYRPRARVLDGRWTPPPVVRATSARRTSS